MVSRFLTLSPSAPTELRKQFEIEYERYLRTIVSELVRADVQNRKHREQIIAHEVKLTGSGFEKTEIMRKQLESCSLSEVCSAMGGSEALLSTLTEKLRDWLSLQPHLPPDVPEYLLKYFVVNTKFSLEIAKQKLDMYYTVRRLVPEIFSKRDPAGPAMRRYYEISSTQVVTLPSLTPEKYRVSIHRHIDGDHEKYNLLNDARYCSMIVEVNIKECISNGDIVIFDVMNVKISHLSKITPAAVKKIDVIMRKAYADSVKEIHVINAAPFLNGTINMAKSILSKKIASRIHVHTSDHGSLYEFIPKSILPSDYGGDEVSMDELNDMWRKKLLERRNWFVEQENVMADESLRPGPMMNADDLFGIAGSFRKLEFD